MPRAVLAIALLAIIVAGTLVAVGVAPAPQVPIVTAADIEAAIRDLGPWGVAASIALMVAHSFVPFPAELLAMANGMVYGPLWGSVITWVGAMLGAAMAFALARWLGRPFVTRLVAEHRRQVLDRWSERQGAGALLLGRLLPVISFNLINYAAGLTAMSWWTFLWATGIGILPLTVLMVVLGDQIWSGGGIWFGEGGIWTAVAAGFILTAYLFWRLARVRRSGDATGDHGLRGD